MVPRFFLGGSSLASSLAESSSFLLETSLTGVATCLERLELRPLTEVLRLVLLAAAEPVAFVAAGVAGPGKGVVFSSLEGVEARDSLLRAPSLGVLPPPVSAFLPFGVPKLSC